MDLTKDVLEGKQDYPMQELLKLGMRNDNIEGAQIQAGFDVTFYKHNGLQGKDKVLHGK